VTEGKQELTATEARGRTELGTSYKGYINGYIRDCVHRLAFVSRRTDLFIT